MLLFSVYIYEPPGMIHGGIWGKGIQPCCPTAEAKPYVLKFRPFMGCIRKLVEKILCRHKWYYVEQHL